MATEWFYTRDGKKTGPLSSSDLKELADSGQLLPTDLIWKEGMAKPRPGIEMPKLFSSGETKTDVVTAATLAAPPASLSLMDKVKDKVKAGARTAATQAEMAALTNFTLPKAYAALGKHLSQSPEALRTFPRESAEIDALTQKLEQIKANAAARTPTTFAEKAKAVALAAKELAESKAHALRLGQAYTNLGKSVFDAGSFDLPTELTGPIKDGLSKVVALGTSSQSDASRPRKAWITKRRLVLGGGTAALVLILVLLTRSPGRGMTSHKAGQSSGDGVDMSYGKDKDILPQYLSGPNGEIIEDLFERNQTNGFVTLLRGYVTEPRVTLEEAAWQGLRQPILVEAKKKGTFVIHGQRITWAQENAPPLPDHKAEATAYAAKQSAPVRALPPGRRYIADYWIAGKCEGIYESYHPDGIVLATGVYKQGVKEGTWTNYWPNGQKKMEQEWVRGKENGRQRGWHDNGKPAVEGAYVEGKPDGKWVWWYPNGQKKTEQTERGGKKEGLQQMWYDDGTLGAVSNYVNGIDEGEACVYWPSGTLKIRLVYKRGEIVESKEWDSEGKEVEQPAKEPLPKSQYEWGIRFGKRLAVGLNQYIEKLGGEKDPSLWKKAYRDIAEKSVLDAERFIREYSHIPNATDHSKGLLKGFSENCKYNVQ